MKLIIFIVLSAFVLYATAASSHYLGRVSFRLDRVKTTANDWWGSQNELYAKAFLGSNGRSYQHKWRWGVKSSGNEKSFSTGYTNVLSGQNTLKFEVWDDDGRTADDLLHTYVVSIQSLIARGGRIQASQNGGKFKYTIWFSRNSCPNNGFQQKQQDYNLCQDCPTKFAFCDGQNLYPCSANCEQCDNQDTCKTCVFQSPNQKFYMNEKQQCVSAKKCGAGKYADDATRKCESCNESCKTCVGGTGADCQTCEQDIVLVLVNPTDSKGECHKKDDVPQIAPHTFIVSQKEMAQDAQMASVPEQDLVTAECDANCKTCHGPSSYCTSCPDGLNLNENKCISTCPDGKFSNGGNCEDCHADCKTCSGAAQTQCLSCDTTFLSGTKCVTECDAGFYADETDNKCKTCHMTCGTCSGGAATDCVKCGKGYFADDTSSTCVTDCPKGFFEDEGKEDNYGGTCTQCSDGCQDCKERQSCDRCFDGYYADYEINIMVCRESCPTNTFAYPTDANSTATKECLDCQDANCESCGIGRYSCTQCMENYFLIDGHCVGTNNCPTAYFEQDVDGVDTCEKCPEGCSSCDDASTCTGCVSINWELNDGVCTQKSCSA